MTSFIRRALSNTIANALALTTASVGLLGSVSTLPAFALPTEQIAARLANVPVYVIGSDSGLLLLSTEENADSASLFVFMSGPQAEGFLANNPELAAENKVMLVSLEKLYQQSQVQGDQSLKLTYIPEETEASQATELSSEYKGGVPLFYAQLEDGSLASVEENGQPIFPLFFSRSDLESNLNALGEQNPEARAAISIGVLPLEFVLAQMKSRDEALFNQIRLLPDSKVIQSLNN